MKLSCLKIQGLRNLQIVSCKPGNQVNLLVGPNGGGKTSFLEAIYLLSYGRSFRSHPLSTVVQRTKERLSVFAQLVDESQEYTLGLEKASRGRVQYKLQGEPTQIAKLASLLPVQLICPDSFKLCTHGPDLRRKFMDWGVFHTQTAYQEAWGKYQRVLKQRNAALKAYPLLRKHVQIWDPEFCLLGEALSRQRQQFLSGFLPIAQRVIESFWANFSDLPKLDLRYEAGWPENVPLAKALQDAWPEECKRGFSCVGPHRADLTMKINNLKVEQVLSRGQLKRLISALQIAQVEYLSKKTGKQSIFLVDDLAAELDSNGRKMVIEAITQQNAQIFITGIEAPLLLEALSESESNKTKMFHVKHGHVEESAFEECFT